jgi:hypothetical protein
MAGNRTLRDTYIIGYSPCRKFQARTADYVTIAIVILVAAGLVAWAFLA